MAFRESSSRGGLIGLILRIVLRFIQLILAVTVIGLYATDINNAHKQGKKSDSKWSYAVVVGTLSSFTALVYMIPFVKSYLAFAWDAVLFILWVAVFGVFGNMYIREDAEGDSGVQRMKNAVWVDLINLLLWFFSAVIGGLLFFKNRHGKSLHTGRATV